MFCLSEKDKGNRYEDELKGFGIELQFGSTEFADFLHKKSFKLALFEFYYTLDFHLERLRLLQPKCRIVMDTVDVHYMRLQMKYELTRDEADLRSMQETRAKELAAYEKSDLLVTVTKDDAIGLKSDLGDFRYFIIPNIHEIVISNSQPQKNTLIFVGGFSHDPNVDAMLYFCNQVLPLVRENADVKLIIVGSNPPEQVQALQNDHVTVTGYVESTTPYLHDSYISVAPLRFGAGMKGKIGEAMAHGLPLVTTSVGAQGMGLKHGDNILIADSEQDFAEAILHLLKDNELYGTIRNNGLRYIQDNFTSEHVAALLTKLVTTIADVPIKRMPLKEKLGFYFDYIMRLAKPAFGLHSHKN